MAKRGRPTRYNQDLIDTARLYIKNYENYGDKVPSNVGLARVLEINRSALYRWSGDEDKEEFKDILDELQATQERVLLNKGLGGEYNSNIVKLMLGKHGYVQQKDNTLSNKDGSPLFGSIKIALVKAPKSDE